MILTGNPMSAKELERAGLITRVVPDDKVLEESLKIAKQIAALSRPVSMFFVVVVDTHMFSLNITSHFFFFFFF
jgi:enoyl-CoA hydratase